MCKTPPPSDACVHCGHGSADHWIIDEIVMCHAETPPEHRKNPNFDECGCEWYLNAAGSGYTHDWSERPPLLPPPLTSGADAEP